MYILSFVWRLVVNSSKGNFLVYVCACACCWYAYLFSIGWPGFFIWSYWNFMNETKPSKFYNAVWLWNTSIVDFQQFWTGDWWCIRGRLVVGPCFITQPNSTHIPTNSSDVTPQMLWIKQPTYRAIIVPEIQFLYYSLRIFTALHGVQTRSSDENSICPSVCPSSAWFVTKRKKLCPHSYTTWNDI